jgi:hypothetical protein
MDGAFFVLLFVALAWNGWQLNEIRKLTRASYVELATARWENGRSVRAKDQRERPSSVGRQGENLPV